MIYPIRRLFDCRNFRWWPRIPLKYCRRFGFYFYHSRNKELLKITQHFLAITQANAPLKDGFLAMAADEVRRGKQFKKHFLIYLLLPVILLIISYVVLIIAAAYVYDVNISDPEFIIVFSFPVLCVTALTFLFFLIKVFQNKCHLWEKLSQKASAGYTLGALVDEAPYLFPPDYRAWIHAGETTGNLVTSLEHINDSYETKILEMYEHRTAFDLKYLLFLFGLTFLLTLLLSNVVFPKSNISISEFFIETTDYTESFYYMLHQNGYYNYVIRLLPWIISVAILIVFMFTTVLTLRKLVVSLCLPLPYFRQIPVYKNLSTFFKLLGHYLNAGIPLESALGVLADSKAFMKPYRKSIKEIQQFVTQGESLGNAIRNCSSSHLYPVVITGLLHLGERGERLPQSLNDIGEYASFRLHRIFRMLYKWIIPLGVLICASIIMIYFIYSITFYICISDMVMLDM